MRKQHRLRIAIYLCLALIEQLELKSLKRLICIVHCQRKNLKNAPLILKAMYCKYAAIAIIPRPKLQKNYDKKMTIENFSDYFLSW